MQVAWDLQAITGPKPTGLGISVAFLKQAFEDHASECELIGLRPNDNDQPLKGVADRLLWEQFRLPQKLRRLGRQASLDLCYSPALGAPLFSPVPVLAHVHDLISLNYPQQFSGVSGWYWKRHLPYTWQRCSALTVSNQTVAEDVSKLLWYDRSRVHIVPYYPDPQLKEIAGEIRRQVTDDQTKKTAADPLFVTIASAEPRKNIGLPLRAVSLLKQRDLKVRLECIGGHTPHTAELISMADELGIAEQISFPGYLERREIVNRLIDCHALLFTSSYEGFGMPPLEAMSLGTAVILSDIACHRHVYTDPVRWSSSGVDDPALPTLVDINDAAALADEMEKLISDANYRRRKQDCGLAFSRTFSPEATAAALQRAFESVAGS